MRVRSYGEGRVRVTVKVMEDAWSEFAALARQKHSVWGSHASGVSRRGWDVVVDELYEAIKAQRRLIAEKGPTRREHRAGLLSTTILVKGEIWKRFVDTVREAYGSSGGVDNVNDELNEAVLAWIKTMKGALGQRQLR